MGMRRLILFAAVHLAGTALLARVSPGLLDDVRAGDPGAALLLVAGWLAVAIGARTTAAVVLTLVWHALRGAGIRSAALRRAALRVAPRTARGALAAAVGGTLTASLMAGPALASSPSPAWPLSSSSTTAPDPAWPLTDETAAPGSDGPADTAGESEEEGDRPVDPDEHEVIAGESLWQIAADRLPGAGDAEIAAGVQELQDANQDIIGTDANLILPGQRLVLP